MDAGDKLIQFRRDARRVLLGLFKPRKLEIEEARKTLNQMLKSRWEINDTEVYELIRENHETPEEAATAMKPIPQYVVFIDVELDVDWMAKGDLEEEANCLVTQAEAVGARRCKHLPREQVLEFKRLIGHAVVTGIRASKPNSQKLCKEAEKFLKERTIERSRRWTLTSAHFFALLFGVGLYFFRGALADASPAGSVRLGCWLGAAGGLVGAYLSVVQKAGSGEWDAASGVFIHRLEVFTKLIAGIILGCLAFILSRSAHVPPSIAAITPDSFSLFIFAVAAGMIERLIPKMVAKYSDKTAKTD
jgi:hypothetical protein